MARLINSTAMTVDGVMEVADWFVAEGDHDDAARSLIEGDVALLTGRPTYEGFAGFWPSQTGPWADLLNPTPKFVASRSKLGPLEWNATAIEGDAVEGVRRLKAERAGGLFLSGCGELARQLIQAGLVDELYFWIHPRIQGSGKRPYEAATISVRLIEAKPFDSGITLLRYQPLTATDENSGRARSAQRKGARKDSPMKTTIAEPTTKTLDVPGATLTYDVRSGSKDATPLFMIGGPMGAAGFTTLASHFADRTVITYDPRGSERSQKADPMEPSPPDVHGDDLHRIIQELGGGPVDLLGSSGGAVFGLALVAKHPEDVGTLVAHEPPLASVLPDRENAIAAARAIHETYQRSGWGAGMAHFIAVVGHRGEFPDGFADQPAPDPTAFGMPTEDDGSRADPMLGSHIVATTQYEPDFDALRRASTRIVMAAGAESEGEMANRGAYAVAEKLGTLVVVFPSDHGGFLGGEYGQTGDPDAFAAKLREVLTEAEAS